METKPDQLFILMQQNINEIAGNKLLQQEMERLLSTLKMTMEEVILLQAENSHLKDINTRKDVLLGWYRKNVEF